MGCMIRLRFKPAKCIGLAIKLESGFFVITLYNSISSLNRSMLQEEVRPGITLGK